MKNSLTKFFKSLCLFALGLLMTATAQAQVGLIINSPSDLSGFYTDISLAVFGPQLDTLDAITGNIVATVSEEACTVLDANSISNGSEIAGNIALINRGTCEFQQKTGNAQEHGAIAVIICLVDGSDPFTMGGMNDTLTIPAIMITLDLCNQIRVALDSGPINVSIENPFNLSQSTAAYANHTPCGQIRPLEELTTTITNRTDNDQTDIIVTCEITDPSSVVTTYVENIDVLTSRTDSIVNFDDYMPEGIGTYTVRYYTNGDAIGNYKNGLDEETMTFEITADYFSLDDGGLNPNGITAGTGDFSMGALFYAENDVEAVSATFGISEPDSIIGESLTIILYELNADATAIDPDNVSVVGFHTYDVTTSDVANELITVDLDNFATPGDPVPITADGIYILMVEYIGDNTFYITASGTINYPGVASIVVTQNAAGALTWFTGGFSNNITAMLRLGVTPSSGGDCTVSVNEPQLDNSQVTLMPNPASETVNIALDLNEAAETVQIHLLDIMGRTIQSEVHNNVKDQVFPMDVSKLASGTYFVNVITDEGRKVLKLTVK